MQQTTPDAVQADVQARFADFSVTANPGFARLYLTKVLDNGDDVQVEVDVQNAVPVRIAAGIAALAGLARLTPGVTVCSWRRRLMRTTSWLPSRKTKSPWPSMVTQ